MVGNELNMNIYRIRNFKLQILFTDCKSLPIQINVAHEWGLTIQRCWDGVSNSRIERGIAVFVTMLEA